MINFFKWLFNAKQYGGMSYDLGGLYRRNLGNDSIQVKNQFGWQEVDESLWWKFIPTNGSRRVIRLPNKQPLCYTDRQRDEMGESAFQLWVDGQRRIALEAMLRRNFKANQ